MNYSPMEAIPTRANKIESNPVTSKSFFEENSLSENHQIVSTATKQGELILSIVQNEMPAPSDDEVVVKIEAAPH